MTVVAWDGKTLAADKRMTVACFPTTVTKIFRVRDGIAGIAGDMWLGQEMIDWYEQGADPAAFPSLQRDKDGWCNFIVIRKDGVWSWERGPVGFRIHDARYAIGHGRDFALAAMHLGKSAAEAVAIAALFDTTCGNGVDTLTLEE